MRPYHFLLDYFNRFWPVSPISLSWPLVYHLYCGKLFSLILKNIYWPLTLEQHEFQLSGSTYKGVISIGLCRSHPQCPRCTWMVRGAHMQRPRGLAVVCGSMWMLHSKGIPCPHPTPIVQVHKYIICHSTISILPFFHAPQDMKFRNLRLKFKTYY